MCIRDSFSAKCCSVFMPAQFTWQVQGTGSCNSGYVLYKVSYNDMYVHLSNLYVHVISPETITFWGGCSSVEGFALPVPWCQPAIIVCLQHRIVPHLDCSVIHITSHLRRYLFAAWSIPLLLASTLTLNSLPNETANCKREANTCFNSQV